MQLEQVVLLHNALMWNHQMSTSAHNVILNVAMMHTAQYKFIEIHLLQLKYDVCCILHSLHGLRPVI
jgi:hypothetical protein